ncbi:hypothetical protein BBH88_18845 [Planococcus antarcticus DSM 14505]|uniref:Uncharacterized protein n=1 Tax=Planococcus antarcticus DSM 14505 TaxID=1185653 RepID=A0ABN4U6V3_9BACL|nr:hypothetical protein BBH88_18845 [Planococcus antarcticus DSM 14505]
MVAGYARPAEDTRVGGRIRSLSRSYARWWPDTPAQQKSRTPVAGYARSAEDTHAGGRIRPLSRRYARR